MDVQEAYRILYSLSLIVIAVLLWVMLIRAVRGPGVTDRLLSINMIGTLVIAAILILSRLLGESWLLDVALIYTMISLVSVLILARVYIPPDHGRKPFQELRTEKKRAEKQAERLEKQVEEKAEKSLGVLRQLGKVEKAEGTDNV